MKFSFSTNAFRKYSFMDAVKAISRAGYEGVEIMCDSPHAWPDHLTDKKVEEIRALVRGQNLSIANLNAFMMCEVQDFHHPSWIEPDQDFRRIRIEYTKKCIRLAAALGTGTISTEPGGPVEGMKKDEAIEIFIQGLAQVLPLAEDLGIKVLIEPEPGLLIQTSSEFLAFTRAFSHPCLGLNLDIGHFYCVDEDPVEVIYKLREFTCHYHLEDIPENREHRHILPDTGGIDIKAVLAAVEDTGYSGFVTLELYPYLDRPEETAVQALDYLRKVCGYA